MYDQATLPSALQLLRSKQTKTTSYLFLFAHIGPCNTLLKPRLAIGSLLDHKLKAAGSTLIRVIVHGICDSMDNVIAIGVGLALRAVIDKLTDSDYRLTGASCYKLIWPIFGPSDYLSRYTCRALGRFCALAFPP